MNKFILFALIACSASLALAAPTIDGMDEETSELSLNPPDDQETDKLKGTNLEGFTDFCLQTRDAVVGDMKKRGNIFASDVFASLFKSLGEVAQSSIDAQAKATDKLSKQLASPGTEIDASSQEEVDKIIADGQKAIQEAGSQPQGFFAAFIGGIKSFGAAGYGQAIQKIMALKEELGAVSVSENLIGFCEKLSTYEKQAIEIFKEAKSGLVEQNAEQYENVQYGEVAPKCITANRLSRAEGFCKFVLAAKEPLSKIFKFKLPESNADH